MKYIKLTLQNHFLDKVLLPPHKGSLLRGAFGWALKKAVCTNMSKECPSCMLKKNCLFSTVFSPLVVDSNEKIHKNLPPAPPPPFIISSHDNLQEEFEEGAEIQFSLSLFGNASEYIPYFIHAITIMGQNGLGSLKHGKRASFVLSQVLCEEQAVYNKDTNHLLAIPQPVNLQIPIWQEIEANPEIFSLHCLSPLRFKNESRLESEFTFETCIRLFLRRLLALNSHYGEGMPELDVRTILEHARRVKIQENKLKWVDVERYSSSQKTKMKLGGLMGVIVFHGNLTLWKPWLSLAEQIHLGKQTAFGYGKIKVE